ncbi:hypothetical protein E2C01_021612 [Portunus trituberculatus]|uniref:Uncharacterized protein n=1 Tax=Portunus trituberculatus TaxID=210409 RepID=A0A5B7E3S6_PORTR|nr:hypothetical protein [Portunus trituberculatus]
MVHGLPRRVAGFVWGSGQRLSSARHRIHSPHRRLTRVATSPRQRVIRGEIAGLVARSGFMDRNYIHCLLSGLPCLAYFDNMRAAVWVIH